MKNLESNLSQLGLSFVLPIAKKIMPLATSVNLRPYLVGGIVRDALLSRPSKDIDICVAGDKDSLINAASEFATERKAKSLYSVPREIGDNDLLRLKTRGYVIGSGRSVSITDKGKEALKSKWLKESNTFKQNRETEKFDYSKHSITRISATDNKKFRRVEG